MTNDLPAADDQPITAVTDTDEKAGDDQPTDWLEELRGLIMLLALVLLFHSFIAKPFYIPSISMMPNLLVGDRLVVSKYPYGWSWVSASFHIFPRSKGKLMGATPAYGDIVIAVPPHVDEDYIKRVVALPGDRIAVTNGQIILNGKPVPQAIQPDLMLPADDDLMCNGVHCYTVFAGYRTRLEDGSSAYQLPIMRETMPNGVSYDIIDHRDQRLDHFEEITVPAGHVFLMGDNRDHSADSRAPIDEDGLGGPVPLADVGGRAEFTTFSLDGSTGWSPASWGPSLRTERAWRSLRPQESAAKTSGEE